MDDVAPLTLTSLWAILLAGGPSTRRRGSVRVQPIFSKLVGMPISSTPNMSVRRPVLIVLIASPISADGMFVDVLRPLISAV